MDRILIVDDEKSLVEFLTILFKKEGYDVTGVRSGQEAIRLIENETFDVVITDILMPDINGLEVLKRAKEEDPEVVVVMITAFATLESSITALKMGASDYIMKPFDNDELKIVIRNALEKKQLRREVKHLKQALRDRYDFKNLIGNSRPMQKVFDSIRKVADLDSTVLLTGESGTGKELVARAIHYASPRKDKNFMMVNCGALPESLLESELFGHKKGSFTGAISEKQGLFSVAHGGTFFLDEIGEAPLGIQVKLLHVLNNRTFKPVGGTEDIHVNVRIISATNQDLQECIGRKEFREDLYWRLNVIPIHTPPLREREEDIALLTRHFVERHCRNIGQPVKQITNEAMQALTEYHWPGNVRELENTIERIVVLESGDVIDVENLPSNLLQKVKEPKMKIDDIPDDGFDLNETVDRYERSIILKALEKTGGIKVNAARLLGLSYRSMRYKLEKHNLQ